MVASTVHPRRCREWADAVPDGVSLVDAPLTLGPFLPERGAVVFAGGPSAVVERIRPLCSAYATEVFHVGSVSAGEMTKTTNNLLLWACYVADYEALRLAAAYGADVERVREALAHGNGRNYAVETWREAWERGGGRWAEDDLRIATELAEEYDPDLPQTERTYDAMRAMTLGELVNLEPREYQ